MTPGQTFHDERSNEEDQEDVVPQKSNIIPLRFNLPGIKKLLLPRSADTDLLDTSAAPARALFGPPTETAVAEKRSSLVDFLKQVTLFEDLSRWDLRRLARIVHERDYHDGEYIFQEGKPGAALFVLRRGMVEVVRRGSSGTEVPLAILEPPASFEESAAMGTESAPGSRPGRVARSRCWPSGNPTWTRLLPTSRCWRTKFS
jgi:Cyclic nucleotide-binding domain